MWKGKYFVKSKLQPIMTNYSHLFQEPASSVLIYFKLLRPYLNVFFCLFLDMHNNSEGSG